MATISGTASDDVLFIPASESNNILLGLEGNDYLDAVNGSGNNVLRGGDGNDEMYALSDDQLFGDAGNDTLTSDGNGSNKLYGGDGNDKIYADRNDNVFGDAGDDEIFAGVGGNTLTGGLGKDIFFIANGSSPDISNTITDFNPVADLIRVNLTQVTQLSDLTIAQMGNDAVISLGGKQLAVIKDTLISNLNGSNVVGGNSISTNPIINQAPIINTTALSVDENSVFGTLVGKINATDPNLGDKLTFAITSGNNDVNVNGKSPFAIDSKTGVITVNDPEDLNFEKYPNFNLNIKVSDAENLFTEGSVKVSLKDIAEPFVTNYEFTNLPKIGTTSSIDPTKIKDLYLGGFSGLYFQGTAANGNLKFVTHTDRGPNGEPVGQERPFLLPDFQPEIVSFELNRTTGTITITKRTGLFAADGTTRLTGLPNLQAGVGGTSYTDEVAVDQDFKPLSKNKDVLGADLEGIVIDDNGNYWMVDEYRPAIYQFDVNGKLINRFIPKGTAAALEPDAVAGTYGTEVLPEVYAQRRANRGFEAVALEGTKLYAFIQSAIDNPDSTGDTTSRGSRNLRILEFDIVTKAVIGEYLYLLDSISGTGNAKTDKIGDAVSLGNRKFAVVERDDRSTEESNKLIYQIDLANATNINNPINFVLPVGKTIEQLSPAELTAANIRPVSKNLIVNAAKSGYTGVEKLEGLALINANTLALINDNDFNVSPGSAVPEKLGILELPTGLPVALKLKKNDSDIFSLSGGSKPQPTISFTVNGNCANQVSELGVFVVDDAVGTIDGIAPNQTGYAERALTRAKVIFSAIGNNPNGFSYDGLNRLLGFNNNDKLRFYSINDKRSTTDLVIQNKSFDKITFSSTTSLNFKELGNSAFNITFNNLEISIKATDENIVLGTGLQDKSEGEVIDLRSVDTRLFPSVKADFILNREAAFNNFVGFYKVENEKGDIKRADGSIISVSQSGYTKAAVSSRVVGIDLSVGDQSTQTSSGIFAAGSIFAPFIVINGNPDAIFDNNSNNDPEVYFSYLGANSDGIDHVRLLGNNTFGFEDLPSGGDFDYNDFIVKVKLTPVV